MFRRCYGCPLGREVHPRDVEPSYVNAGLNIRVIEEAMEDLGGVRYEIVAPECVRIVLVGIASSLQHPTHDAAPPEGSSTHLAPRLDAL